MDERYARVLLATLVVGLVTLSVVFALRHGL